MKLGTKGRYAVMAMVDLALNSRLPNGDTRPVTLSEIAERQEISLSYLEQLFAKLRRTNLVDSVRGPGGGYSLAHSPDTIRVADVVSAVDEPLKATRCSHNKNGGCMSSGSRCITHDLWDELGNQIYLFLNSITLSDVIERKVLGRSGLLHQDNFCNSNGAVAKH